MARATCLPKQVRYAQALGLEGDEASYFLDLVVFTQARTPHAERAVREAFAFAFLRDVVVAEERSIVEVVKNIDGAGPRHTPPCLDVA